MPQKGRVMPERSQGRLERRVGRDAADSAHGRVEGLQAPGRERVAGMEGRCRTLEMPQGPEDFYKDKNKKRHNRGCGIS